MVWSIIPEEYSPSTKQTLWLQEEENQSKEEETTQFPGDAGDTRTVTTLDENQDPDNDLVYWPGKSTTVLVNQSNPIFRWIDCGGESIVFKIRDTTVAIGAE